MVEWVQCSLGRMLYCSRQSGCHALQREDFAVISWAEQCSAERRLLKKQRGCSALQGDCCTPVHRVGAMVCKKRATVIGRVGVMLCREDTVLLIRRDGVNL